MQNRARLVVLLLVSTLPVMTGAGLSAGPYVAVDGARRCLR